MKKKDKAPRIQRIQKLLNTTKNLFFHIFGIVFVFSVFSKMIYVFTRK